MANPMQRRAKNSFLLGFLIAVIIMALVVAFLVMRMRKITDEKNAMEAKTKSVYVAAADIDSDAVLTPESLKADKVQTSLDVTKIVNTSTLNELDENDEQIIYKTKVAVPAGTIITTDMIYRDDESISNDERIQEYSMIELPSHLKNGDYIDIRFALANGEDYVVLSKKKVEGTDQNTLWMKVTEDEILTLNSAIVDSYIATGCKLYAIEYTEPGLQEKATQNYPVSLEIIELIRNNPNILNEAKNASIAKYNQNEGLRTNRINPIIQQYIEERDTLVQSGYESEASKKQELRQNFISELEGTGQVGYSKE